MYIGIKSDIYQLGMVLWAIAMENDEPETQSKPLTMYSAPADVPTYFCDIVDTCLSPSPRHRLQASAVLKMFPFILQINGRPNTESVISLPRSEEEYVDPAYVVDRDDIYKSRGTDYYTNDAGRNDRSSNAATHTYVDDFYPRRGRSLSPRPVNGNSPSARTLYVVSPSIDGTLEKEELTSSHSEERENKLITIVSPPSPPPTAEKWIDPSLAYSESDKPHTHYLDLIESPAHTTHPKEQEDPRKTAADRRSNSSYLDCVDLAGVGAHHTTTSLVDHQSTDIDILSDFEKLDMGDNRSDMGTALHIEDDLTTTTMKTTTKAATMTAPATTAMTITGMGTQSNEK